MKYSDEDVLDYCDGTMNEDRSAEIQQEMQRDDNLAHRIEAMKASRLPYKEAFAQQPIPELPKSLQTDVGNWVHQVHGPSSAPRLDVPASVFGWFKGSGQHMRLAAGMAASLVICFALGYGVGNDGFVGKDSATQLHLSTQEQWVQRVAQYQSLYVENTVSGINNGEKAASSLLDSIKARTDMRTGVPDLSSLGYRFVRAQELGYQNEPLVQLVYFKPGHAPLAVCYMPATGEMPAEMKVETFDGLLAAGWIHNEQRFVIVGDESREVIEKLYEQTNKLLI